MTHIHCETELETPCQLVSIFHNLVKEVGMITIHDDRDHNAILVEPLEELTREDFAELTKRFDAYVNQYDSIPNLIIHAPAFPGWDSFGAMTQHLKFIENHQKLIRKIAIVSDSASLSVFPSLVDHFVSAKVRRFSENRLDEAKNWVASTEEEKEEKKKTVLQSWKVCRTMSQPWKRRGK